MIKEIRTQAELDAHVDGKEFCELMINAKCIVINTLWENSTATLWENSTATLRGNSTATLWENSTATLWENSTATLWENSTATLWENSTAKAHDASVAITRFANKVCVYDAAQCVKVKDWKHTRKSFLKTFVDRGEHGGVILYKSVHPETLCDFYTGTIKYEGVVTCPDWDGNQERECGGGLHLSPAPDLALEHNQGQLLKCEVMPRDFVVFSGKIDRVRCRKVLVIGKCDSRGNIIKKQHSA